MSFFHKENNNKEQIQQINEKDGILNNQNTDEKINIEKEPENKKQNLKERFFLIINSANICVIGEIRVLYFI